MKKILIILLLGIFFEANSQKVSVELSIEWKKTESNRWKKYKLENTPFLKITYINNSIEPIYFTKVPKNFNISAYDFPSDKKRKKDVQYFKRIKKHYGEKYFVEISTKYWSQDWSVKDENEKQITKEEIELSNNNLNEDLHDIYKYLYKDYEYTRNPFIFMTDEKKTTITEENIFTNLRDYFIFLEKGENHIDYYDLTGFYIMGGEYNFSLTTNKLNDFVETVFITAIKEYKNEQLPLKVKEYKLYSGELKTNEVSIQFNDKK